MARHVSWLLLAATLGVGCAAQQPTVPVPVDLEVGRGRCAPFPELFDCALAVEDQQLAASRGTVRRRDEAICMQLNRGDELCVANENPPDESASKRVLYLGTLAQPAKHVLWVWYYEGSEVLLIDAGTGRRDTVDAVPVASPSGKYLAASSADVAYGTHRVSIWEADGDTLLPVGSLDPDPADWSPGPVEWLADTALLVRRFRYDQDAGTERNIDPIRVERRDGVWKVLTRER